MIELIYRVIRWLPPESGARMRHGYSRSMDGSPAMSQDTALHVATLTKREFPDNEVVIQESANDGESWRPYSGR